jgi:lipoate-protein ligase A
VGAALGRGTPWFQVATLNGPELSLGVAQRDDEECAVRARHQGIPVGRRSSGGTAVLIEAGDWAWSLVLPRSDPRVGRDYARAFARFGGGVVQALEALGVSASWSAPHGISDSLCVLGPRGSVLEVNGRVVGGCAQHLTATTLLHHGILIRTVDRGRLAPLFDLSPELLAVHLGSLEEDGAGELTTRDLASHIGSALQIPGEIDRRPD